MLNPKFEFIPNDTLIFFDEIQDMSDVLSCLKFFKLDGKYDLICSGSLLGVTYKSVSFIPVGFKTDYKMQPLDFEEFLWAKGYNNKQIDSLFKSMKNLKKLNEATMTVMRNLFKQYIFTGGMPKSVNTFINTNQFNKVFLLQDELYKLYQEDIMRYVDGLDAAKVKNIYTHISSQLAKDNHKFQTQN